MSKHGLIGPIWFEDENEQADTVNTERYIQVLGKFRTTLLRRWGVVRVMQWFQQEGAAPHTSNESMEWLQQRFPDRLISRRSTPEWSPHSPDLNPLDFYLWRFLKDRVYVNNAQTISDLKAAISAAIQAISRDECRKVIDNFAHRISVCAQCHGAHLEHVLWLTIGSIQTFVKTWKFGVIRNHYSTCLR